MKRHSSTARLFLTVFAALASTSCGSADPRAEIANRDAAALFEHCPPGEAPSCRLVRGKNVCVCAPIDQSPPVCTYGVSPAPIISGGDYHTCAIAPDSTARCWGQLPSGGESITATVSATGVKAVAGGGTHDCVVTIAGAVHCWGANGSGQLGDGTLLAHALPAPVAGISDATRVAAGYTSSCALHATGRVSCWGANDSGQLGNGTTLDSALPVDVTGISNAVAIGFSPAYDDTAFACALLADGTVRCWGNNLVGQLGSGVTGGLSTVPVTVTSLSNVVGLSVGLFTACAVDCFGRASCWGYNGEGEVGDGTTTSRPSPTAVSVGADVVAVASGEDSCALRVDGTMACWGVNNWGVLGTGDRVPSLTPHLVAGLTSVTTIDAQLYRTCAGKADGSVYCWGSFNSLGDGTTSPRLSPTRVIGMP